MFVCVLEKGGFMFDPNFFEEQAKPRHKVLSWKVMTFVKKFVKTDFFYAVKTAVSMQPHDSIWLLFILKTKYL